MMHHRKTSPAFVTLTAEAPLVMVTVYVGSTLPWKCSVCMHYRQIGGASEAVGRVPEW